MSRADSRASRTVRQAVREAIPAAIDAGDVALNGQPTYKTIAKHAGLSVDWVKVTVRDLDDRGDVERSTSLPGVGEMPVTTVALTGGDGDD